MMPNISAHTDTQKQVAAARQFLSWDVKAPALRPIATLLFVFFLTTPWLVCAGSIQSAQQGAQPIKDRLGAVEAERKSIERRLVNSNGLPFDTKKLETKLSELKAEKLQLEAELKEMERLSASPMVTHLSSEVKTSGAQP